ncbi:hypothetical protein K461DRAFT_101507 [Myriangium duriaei CBS 260.36]|uniref:Uncharacterized protein n=1 Tax=Myriangium duriaei CBS 260.36 TaxID=1168546 RepID=A0A9P4J3G3_9PEZI|nr:hypothetical protein K461DRAFT_101507 [Myriangium duriaei CBS 260.36]
MDIGTASSLYFVFPFFTYGRLEPGLVAPVSSKRLASSPIPSSLVSPIVWTANPIGRIVMANVINFLLILYFITFRSLSVLPSIHFSYSRFGPSFHSHLLNFIPHPFPSSDLKFNYLAPLSPVSTIRPQ